MKCVVRRNVKKILERKTSNIVAWERNYEAHWKQKSGDLSLTWSSNDGKIKSVSMSKWKSSENVTCEEKNINKGYFTWGVHQVLTDTMRIQKWNHKTHHFGNKCLVTMKVIKTNGKVQRWKERTKDYTWMDDIKVSHKERDVKALIKGEGLRLLGIRNKGEDPTNRPKTSVQEQR